MAPCFVGKFCTCAPRPLRQPGHQSRIPYLPPMPLPASLLHGFYHQETTNPDRPYLHQPFGEKWETYSWAEVGQMARKVATYLHHQKLPLGSHIGLVSKNCREWIIADVAIMMAGHVSVPFFATLTGDQIAEALELGDVVLLIAGKMEVWADMRKGVPANMPVVHFPHYEGNSIKRGRPGGTTWLSSNRLRKARYRNSTASGRSFSPPVPPVRPRA